MGEALRVLITASRTWTDQFAVWDALDALLSELPSGERLIVVHGGASDGGDLMADEWVTMKRGAWIRRAGRPTSCPVEREVHEPDYSVYPSRVAPQKRNELMVSLGADKCLAFLMPCEKPGCRRQPPVHPTHGAGRTAQLARKAGISTDYWGDPALR